MSEISGYLEHQDVTISVSRIKRVSKNYEQAIDTKILCKNLGKVFCNLFDVNLWPLENRVDKVSHLCI